MSKFRSLTESFLKKVYVEDMTPGISGLLVILESILTEYKINPDLAGAKTRNRQPGALIDPLIDICTNEIHSNNNNINVKYAGYEKLPRRHTNSEYLLIQYNMTLQNFGPFYNLLDTENTPIPLLFKARIADHDNNEGKDIDLFIPEPGKYLPDSKDNIDKYFYKNADGEWNYDFNKAGVELLDAETTLIKIKQILCSKGNAILQSLNELNNINILKNIFNCETEGDVYYAVKGLPAAAIFFPDSTFDVRNRNKNSCVDTEVQRIMETWFYKSIYRNEKLKNAVMATIKKRQQANK